MQRLLLLTGRQTDRQAAIRGKGQRGGAGGRDGAESIGRMKQLLCKEEADAGSRLPNQWLVQWLVSPKLVKEKRTEK